MVDDTCALCGGQNSTDVEVCQLCQNDARILEEDAALLAPEAHARAKDRRPDWAEEHREAHKSGEMLDGYRGDGQ